MGTGQGPRTEWARFPRARRHHGYAAPNADVGIGGGGERLVGRTRTGASALVVALLAGVLSVVTPAGPAAAWSPPTLDGPTYDWITPGPGYRVSGTVPGGAGLTVTAYLYSFGSPGPVLFGTATIAADDTFSVTGDTSPVTMSGSLAVDVPQTYAGGTGTTELRRDLWVDQGAPMLTLDVPGGGAPVTDLGPKGCLPVTGHLADPTLTWNSSAPSVYVGDGMTVTSEPMFPGSNGADPSTLTGCVPLDAISNGTIDVWISLLTPSGAEYNTRVQVPLALVSSTGPAQVYASDSYVNLILPVTNPGPDTSLAVTLDGAPDPAVGPVPLWRSGPGYVYQFDDNALVWDTTGQPLQLLADGVHIFHAVLTSRGVVTDLGDFPVTVDTQAHMTVDAVSADAGSVTVTGHEDNIVPDVTPNPTIVVTHPGMSPVSGTRDALITTNGTGGYGTSTWSETVGVTLPADGIPSTVTVSGHDYHGNVVTVSAQVPAIFPPTSPPPTSPPPPPSPPPVPGAPTGVTARVGNASAQVFWGSASVNLSPVTGYVATASPGGASCSTPAYLLSCVVPGLTNGVPYTFTVTASNAYGMSPASAPSAPVIPDGTPPAVTVTALPLVILGPSVTASWAASDPGSGVGSYDVRFARAGYGTGLGSWAYPTEWQDTVGTSLPLSLSAGVTMCLSVRAHDRVGNVSAWSPVRCVTRPLDDRSLVSGTGWARGHGSAFYLSTVTSTTALSAVLVRTGARLDRVGVVATRCRTCGLVGVYVGRTLVGKLNLYMSSTRYRQVLLLPRFSYRSGSVVVRSLSTHKLVQVDGLVVTVA